MSNHFLSLYRPIADALLSKHGLSVPAVTRDCLAKDIMYSRELPQGEMGKIHTPQPALRSAAAHARALIGYAEKPPVRSDSIA